MNLEATLHVTKHYKYNISNIQTCFFISLNIVLMFWITLLSSTIPIAAWAVKSTEFNNMITPTAVLVRRAARLTIQPLKQERKTECLD